MPMQNKDRCFLKVQRKGGISLNKIIEVKNLRKSYGEIQAVADISFYVEQGKLFSFLGPNGAGKIYHNRYYLHIAGL